MTPAWPLSSYDEAEPRRRSHLFYPNIIAAMLPDGFLRLDPRFVLVRQIVGLITTGIIATVALVALVAVAAITRPAWSLIWLGAGAWFVVTGLLTWWLWTWPG